MSDHNFNAMIKPTKKIKLVDELGVTGLNRFSGFIHEEFLRELQGRKGMEAYMEMRDNDAVIGAFLFAVEMLIRKIDWRIQPASEDNIDREAAAFLRSNMEDMSSTWDETICEILSMLVFGFSYHELVYKRRLGDSRDPTRRSRFEDGRISWRKLPIRAQETVWEWKFGEHGEIQGMVQQAPPDWRHSFIPIEKALLFRPKSHKGNPEGRSILRNAYRSWYMKKNIENIEGIGIERDLAGLPVALVPPEMLQKDASDGQKAVLAQVKTLIKNIRRDEQEGVIFPMAYNEEGKPLYELKLLSTGGSRQFDTNKIVDRYDQRIAMTVLADFILLGHQKHGSFALSSSKTSLFSQALNAFVTSIEQVLNRIAVPRLFALNVFPLKKLPQFTHGDVETVDLDELGNFIAKLTSSGMPLFPDPDLENYLKRQAGMPLSEEEPLGSELTDRSDKSDPDDPFVAPKVVGDGAAQGALSERQIRSILEINKAVSEKRIEREVGVNIIRQLMNKSEEEASVMITTQIGSGVDAP